MLVFPLPKTQEADILSSDVLPPVFVFSPLPHMFSPIEWERTHTLIYMQCL